MLVDCAVVAKPENHWQTFSEPYSPAFAAEIRVPASGVETMGMSARKIIARRAAPRSSRAPTTSSFRRAKLGDALEQRAVAPCIHECSEEAHAHLREIESGTTGRNT